MFKSEQFHWTSCFSASCRPPELPLVGFTLEEYGYFPELSDTRDISLPFGKATNFSEWHEFSYTVGR